MSLPGADDLRRGVRPDRVVQPARGARRRHPAGVLGLPDGRPHRAGPTSSRSSTASTPTPGPTWDGWCQAQGAPPLAAARLHPHLARLQPLRLPARARLHRRPAARRHLAPDRLQRPRDRRGLRRCPPSWPTGPEGSGLVYLSLGSLGGADVGLMQRLIDVLGTSRHRVDREHGPARRRAAAGRQHDRRRDRAADQGDPAGRPGDHPRRQQHDDRGDALRQADDRAAAVLGPVRQRPARRTSSASASGCATYAFTDDELTRRRRPAAGRHRPAASGWTRSAPTSGRATGCAGAPRSSSRSAWSAVPEADLLTLDATHAIRVVADRRGPAPRRSCCAAATGAAPTAGDGAAVALSSGCPTPTRSTPTASGSAHREAPPVALEPTTSGRWASTRPTSRGSSAGSVVVKWMTDRWSGPTRPPTACAGWPPPASRESPALWGLVEWREPAPVHWVPVAVAQSYLPGTEDGWTWAVAEARRALRIEPGRPRTSRRDLGDGRRPDAPGPGRRPAAPGSSAGARAAARRRGARRARPGRPADRAARPRRPTRSWSPHRASDRGDPRRPRRRRGSRGPRRSTATSTSARCSADPRRRTPSSTSTATRPARPRCVPRTRRRPHATSPTCWSAWRTSATSPATRRARGRPDAAALDWTAWPGPATRRGCSSSGYRRALGDRRDLFDPALLPAYALGAAVPRVRVRRPAPAGVALRRPRLAASPAGGGLMDPDLFLADLAEKPARLADLAAALRADDPWAGARTTPTGRGCCSAWAPRTTPTRSRPPACAPAGSRRSPSWPATDLLPVGRPGDDRRRGVRLGRLGRDPRRRTPAPRAPGGGARLRRAHQPADADRLVALCDDDGRPCCGRRRSAAASPAARSSTRSPCCSRSRRGSTGAAADVAVDCWTARPRRAPTSSTPRDDWLPAVSAAALGPDGTHVVAPARRISSALQSALMLREGPRLPAYACETADWSHVDVYLTKTTDYRLVLLAGSRWEPELLDWVRRARQHPGRGRRRRARRRGDRALPARRRGRRPAAHRDPGRRAVAAGPGRWDSSIGDGFHSPASPLCQF